MSHPFDLSNCKIKGVTWADELPGTGFHCTKCGGVIEWHGFHWLHRELPPRGQKYHDHNIVPAKDESPSPKED